MNHFDRWLVNLGIFSSDWSHSFFLTNKIIPSTGVGWATTFTSWFVILCLIASIIICIIIQKCSSTHICWESLTSFYLFEILLFALDGILIILLTIWDRWHLRHKRMRSFLVFLVTIKELFSHYLLLYLSILGCLLWSYPMKFKISCSW